MKWYRMKLSALLWFYSFSFVSLRELNYFVPTEAVLFAILIKQVNQSNSKIQEHSCCGTQHTQQKSVAFAYPTNVRLTKFISSHKNFKKPDRAQTNPLPLVLPPCHRKTPSQNSNSLPAELGNLTILKPKS